MQIVTLIQEELAENPQLPFYLNFIKALQKGIADNSLPVSSGLPTHRKLAEELSLSVGTVTRAYKEAQKHSLISSVIGRGTII